MTANILEVRRLHSGYGVREVISDVSFDVPKGSIAAVVGPNGHGKTTLLWTISGLVKPRAGSIQFDGLDITGYSPDRIARLGLAHAPQGDLLFARMTIRDNLLMGGFRLSSQAEVKQRCEYVFELFPKLAQRQHQLTSSLSGGERRMVGLGRALMAGASLLMVDEPSLGLAPIVIDQIYEALVELKKQGLSIILVEENPERVSDLADQMFVVDDGSIVMSGPPQDILNKSTILDAYFGN
jgi:branched-chain amino acid transport system ATP-binding protein